MDCEADAVWTHAYCTSTSTTNEADCVAKNENWLSFPVMKKWGCTDQCTADKGCPSSGATADRATCENINAYAWTDGACTDPSYVTEETCLSVVERAKLIEALYAYLLRVRAIELSSKHTLTGKFSWKQSTNQAAHLIFPLCGQRLECRGVNTDPFEQAEPFKLEWPANCFAYIKFDPPFFAENIHPKPKKWTAGYLKFGNIDYPS